MLTRTDLPTFLLSDTDTHISKTGVWVYAGGSAGSWTIAPAQPSPRATDSQTYFVKVRATAGPLTVGRSNADTFAYGSTNPISVTIQPGQTAMFTPGPSNVWEVAFLTPTAISTSTVSAAGTLTLDRNASLFVFTGTTTTWTLPALATNVGLTYRIKNRGSGDITLQRAGSDQLYTTAAVTSITIAAGASAAIINDGTYWDVL